MPAIVHWITKYHERFIMKMSQRCSIDFVLIFLKLLDNNCEFYIIIENFQTKLKCLYCSWVYLHVPCNFNKLKEKIRIKWKNL